ncbi:HNH endonuclease signature motif containing protein [Psychroserpens sp.]|uniref:HNH endonuclease signature motif containing protein n=1 Tax=Psychroserpens sp. TaxID=2020870 RepID=UPI001B280239|nr:HNH endonuclease signature motif containing protein [Psychroserpens sp.]MBO6607404.1 HNH endonuclease [Psychroserpens sp.]MBO6632464.1 HNH endonuclease [Psychroserpens sp.]MBO6654518.1 HNH endonuclease [Psychroserpens sp.]MBO6681133.1 HNH endonuclease [Psychroserpens sp.]MBO6749910.1 HNH endonuclease [Psychroserpens sp.]
MEILLETYNDIKECSYKNEHYSVRDNGSVLRHAQKNRRIRPTDNKWTFGKLNKRTGYLEIASVRIHRIVATAFHGKPSSKLLVVDHIDTNKHNNRPENLRWVTRLENVLLNPITLRRVELICGSAEAFLADPSKFRDKFQNPNYQWMCAVSKEEAELSKKRLLAWAKSNKPLQGGTLGDWIYNRNLSNEFDESANEVLEFINSLTPNAVQIAQNWKTPSEFPCCPSKIDSNALTEYYKNLNIGKVFSRNQYTSSIVQDVAISEDKNILWIMCKSGEENPIKPYSLAEITFNNNVFVHDSLGTFFEKIGAEKQFTLKQGLEWMGGDSIDDYC